MAEIPVQPKRGAGPWVWLVALIVLAIILWFIFGRRHTATTTTGRATPAYVSRTLAARTGVATARSAIEQ
ncbi:MAG TPA: hypothetical protein VFS44_12220 [Gemmatimonadaceae bacterium]|nr:hypothetical protein [Gemmatimonadaceae bacterium]